MTDSLTGPADAGDGAAAQEAVERERAEMREFVDGLTVDDLDSGAWFAKLCARALRTHTEKATWEYFQGKYLGMPADGIVDRRIKLAARYAMIEGGLSSAAYTAAVAATIGTRGGASRAMIPAGAAAFVVDMAVLSQLQIRLAYDIAAIYRIPLNVDDPEDLWKLVRVAFAIKTGEVARTGATKFVPGVVRQVVKKYYSGAVRESAMALPYVGQHLLQRNVIKFGIPAIGIPVTVVVNRWTTKAAGRYARSVFRNEARVIEVVETLIRRTRHPKLILWVAWLVINADATITDDETLLFQLLTRLVREHHQVTDEHLARVIDINPGEVWRRVAAETGDLSDVIDAAEQVAAIDGDINAAEKAVIAELRDRCSRS
ncbi:hypothetical protein [Plantactinospora sp. WMMB782]|uniref:tellurite resistance TerB family protein n=1 Tax=Plantactinospora sp. WMMB782 TaxID=3404121 RepID=UPI003B954050